MFDRLRQEGLTLQPEMVAFGTLEIHLGHLDPPGCVRINPECTRPIREFPIPKDTKGLARFIGMVKFYHKFIPRFADDVSPFNAVGRNG